MKKSFSIYLFRHGQSVYNAGGMRKNARFTGWRNIKLTKLGLQQAKKIAKKLKNKKIDIAFQTRLSRSKDTLKEVLKYHPECRKIITDDRMIERSYGKLQGLKHKTAIQKYGLKQFNLWHRSYNVRPPKGESLKDVEKRVNSFIKDLLRMIKQKRVNVAISAHGKSMRPFRKYFEHLTRKQMISLENPYDDYFEYKIN